MNKYNQKGLKMEWKTNKDVPEIGKTIIVLNYEHIEETTFDGKYLSNMYKCDAEPYKLSDIEKWAYWEDIEKALSELRH